VKYCLDCGTKLPELPAPEALIPQVPTPMPAERKTVTIFFADIVGSTEKAEKLDPEEWREVVAGAHRRVGEAVGRYEGTVAQLLGDGVLAFFGAPVTHEDDPERAVRTALDLQKAIEEYAAELAGYVDGFAMRVGIHAGTVVVGEIGSEERSEYLAVGDAVNVAARLEGAAEPGQIVVSEQIARRVRAYFDLTDLGPMELKGKAEPLSVYAVVGEKDVPARERGLEGAQRVFVGRQQELEELQQALLELCRGHGQIRFILGEAGIGKSRLVEELRERPPKPPAGETLLVQPGEVRWLEARAPSYGDSLAYRLISQLILADLGLTDGAPAPRLKAALGKRTIEILDEQAAEFRPYLGHLLGLHLDPEDEERISQYDRETLGREIRRAILSYFEALATSTPTVLVLEDLHWADASSLEVLGQLLSMTNRAPLMIMALMRIERDHGSWDLKQRAERDLGHRYGDILVKPLAGGDAKQILASVLGSDSELGEVAELVLGKAEGNPFYLEELLRHLLERELIVEKNMSWKLTAELEKVGVPETLQGVLLARIGRLEDEVQHTLQLASVIGRTFLYRVLAVISEAEEELDLHLDELQRVDLVRERARLPELEYIFKHALTQEAAYSSLLIERRQQFHRRVAQAIEQLFEDRLEEFYALLAHHYESAGEVEEAVKCLTRAADRASLEDSLVEAKRFLLRLSDLLKDDQNTELESRIWLKLGLLQLADFEFSKSRQSFEKAFLLTKTQPTTALDRRNSHAPPSATERTLRVSLDADGLAMFLHPEGEINFVLLAGLAYLDYEMNAVPHMAKSWEVMDNGSKYVFYLQGDASWSDGTPLTARDFEWSWLWRMKNRLSGTFFDEIVGAADFRDGKLDDPSAVGVRALDEKTLQVRLNRPSPHFLYVVTRPNSFPLPRRAVEREGRRWWRAPEAVFNGPFTLASVGEGGFVIRRNKTYFGAYQGDIAQLECTVHEDMEKVVGAFQSGELDLVLRGIGASPPEVPTDQVYSPPYRQLSALYLMLNPAVPPTDNLDFRRALAYAVDRTSATSQFGNAGMSAYGGIVPPGMPGHSPEIGIPYDLGQARTLLGKAFGGVIPNKVNLRAIEPPLQRTKAWRESHLNHLMQGLDIRIDWDMFDFGDMTRRHKARANMAFQGWTADFPDPHNFLSNCALEDLRNLSGQLDATLTQLIENAAQAQARKERLELLRAADRYLVQDQVFFIPLTYGPASFDLVKPWVKNFRRNVLGDYRLEEVVIEPH
jgi:ABC-type oligopeptide transport system substrate-binding subunit/class 3 adenylate cyclase